MPALASSLRQLLRSLGDFVFPPICYGCDDETDAGLVCDSCRLLLFTSELAVCPDCGRACLPTAGRCGRCDEPFHLNRVRALGTYAPPFSTLVQAFKYSEKTRVGELLGVALSRLVMQDSLLSGCDIVCAIPLHPARLRERGYNQSLLLAAAVAVASGIPLAEPLVRKKNTRSQTTKTTPEARRRNLEDAFKLRPGADVVGKRVLLVDDVMTTGATLNAAAEVLLQGGAASVSGAVVAAACGAGQSSLASASRAPARSASRKRVSPVSGAAD
jgi:ComF family protein